MNNQILTLELREKIRKHAGCEKPNEACGLIYKSGEYLDIYPCKNISSNKTEHFELSPFDYLKAIKKGKLVGMYHSQKDINPSILDYIVSQGHKIYSVVYSYENDTFVEINEAVIKYIKYIGRPFELNKNNCYSLIRDFYQQEYNILLNWYDVDNNLFIDKPNIIKDNYIKEGFIEIKFDELEIGDAIVFGLTNYNVHIGIYLDNNLFLHHPYEKYSTAEQLNDSWKRRVVMCAKHKDRIYE